MKRYLKRYLKKVVFCTKDRPWELDSAGQGVLYIVDTKQGLDLIKSLGLPVLAWLREERAADHSDVVDYDDMERCTAENNDDGQDLSGAAYAVEDPYALDMDFYERVYRREMHIPWEILETERCLVREMIPEDAAAFEEIYQAEAISRYMKDFQGNAAAEAEYIRQYQAHYRFYEYGVWSIVLKENGQVIGRAGFLEAPRTEAWKNGKDISHDEESMSMDAIPYFGYMIGVPWQRQGLAEEVCRGLLTYAREELGFEVVQLLVERDNEASIRLAKKLGFTDAGNGCQVLHKVLHLT